MRRLRTAKLVVVSAAGLLLALLNISPALAQSANDDFGSATIVNAWPFTDTISTTEATAAVDDPSCSGNEHSVWYSLTPSTNATIEVDTAGSDYATTLSVYTGARGALDQLSCTPYGGRVSVDVSAGTTYFFMVGSACCGGPGGTLVFTLNGPVTNDEIGGAIPLTLNTTVTEDTTRATTGADDPTACASGFGGYHSVWFSFTATQSQPLEFDRSGSSYEGESTILTDLGSGPVPIACGRRFDAIAGKTYFYLDASFWQGGQLQLTVRPAIVMTVAIDQTATVDRQGVAVVSGTLACSQGVGIPRGDMPTLAVNLRQRISKTLVIEGSKNLFVPCPTTPTGWSATIVGANGPFQKGQAEVLVAGMACDGAGCDTPEVRQLVDMQRPK